LSSLPPLLSIVPDYGDFDEDTAFLGQTGPYFWTTFFLLNTVFISTGFNGLYIVFIGSAPEHHCLVPDANLTAGDVNLSGLSQEPCLDGWTYSKAIYQSTIVTEWDLVCDNQWKVPFASSTLFVGYLLGSLISGQLSDRFGRKKVLFVSLAAQCMAVLLQSFSHSWRMFCVMFLFIGASQISLYISAFVLGKDNHACDLLHAGAFLFYCIGYMTLPWIAYAIREWRTLLAVLAATSVVYIPLWWFIPESPRWLVTQGRSDEAEQIVRDAARRNGVEAPAVIFKEAEVSSMSRTKYTMLDVLRSRNIRCITLMCLVLWMAINIGYFGLSLNTSNLSGDPFMNCFLSAISEVPAYVFIPETLQSVALALEMTGKFGFTMAFGTVYIYTAELYPTVIRNVGMGMCSSAARVGSITAPYVIYLGTYNKILPYIVMGSLTMVSCVVNLFLPETLNKDLPETIDQMQQCNWWVIFIVDMCHTMQRPSDVCRFLLQLVQSTEEGKVLRK
uniref:Solute carrier family 22 member 5 n=1 Tax=Neogobius melanostomus TaxID=47308 RepID=A0A8C6TPP3_9GOBI